MCVFCFRFVCYVKCDFIVAVIIIIIIIIMNLSRYMSNLMTTILLVFSGAGAILKKNALMLLQPSKP